MSESKIQSEMRLRLGSQADIRIFRNLVGEAWVGPSKREGNRVVIDFAKRVRFGLCPGSADLIGITSYRITPDDVGKIVGVFTSVEVKAAANSSIRDNQHPWRQMVDDRGGIALISHQPSEALYIVQKWKPHVSLAPGNDSPT